MDFTDEQKLMRESLLALAEEHLPVEKIRAAGPRQPAGRPDAYRALAKGGWLGLPLSGSSMAGCGGSYKDVAILLETLSYHYACLGTTYMTSAIYAGLQLLYNGSEHLKQTYMVPMIKGDIYIAFALTEPQTGSDAASIKTNAVRDGDDYIIRGQKWFITSAHVADYLVLVVKTDPSAKPAHDGFSLFLVDAKAPGVSMQADRDHGAAHHPHQPDLLRRGAGCPRAT